MAFSKNPGKLLTSVYSGLVDAIPLRWRTKLGIVKTVRQQPLDVDVSPLTTSLVASSVEQEFTDERKKTDVTLNDPTGKTMVEYVMTKEGQVGTRIVKYVPEGTTPPTFNELTQEFNQEASGNGWSEQILLTVPNLFGGYDYSTERRDAAPPEFVALVPIFETTHIEAGPAAPVVLITGQLMGREVQLTEDTKRVTIRIRDVGSLPKQLVGKDTDEHKQIVTVTRTWQLDATSLPSPSDTTDVKLERLGDGTSIQTVRGVPNVFGGNDYRRERPDRVPPEFAALLQVKEEVETVTGIASMPGGLADGELMREQVQVTAFTKRTTVRYRDLDLLPRTLVSKDTSNKKQVVTITRIWEVDTTTPSVPTATLDVSFEKLGDGTAIETRKFETVFPGPAYGVTIENLIPVKFRAHIPTKTSEITSTGTANPTPTLATGELSHEEQQIDAFNIRTKSVTFGALSPPITHTAKESTTDNGGGILDVVYTLNVTGTYAVEVGELVVASEVVDLGNGYEIRTTKSVEDPWPLLTEYDQDPETQSLITTTYQVVDATAVVAPSTLIGVITRYKRIDEWRSLEIIETYSLPASYEEQRFMAHNFPSLWDYITYAYSTACGPTGPIREGFASMVEARVAISFTTSKSTIVGLSLIPNTIRLVHDIISAVLNDAGGVTYVGSCSGTILFPASSPDYSTYIASIQGTEQLITGESVLWRAGLYKNTELYVTMI